MFPARINFLLLASRRTDITALQILALLFAVMPNTGAVLANRVGVVIHIPPAFRVRYWKDQQRPECACNQGKYKSFHNSDLLQKLVAIWQAPQAPTVIACAIGHCSSTDAGAMPEIKCALAG
jgi:hypothetical protein